MADQLTAGERVILLDSEFAPFLQIETGALGTVATDKKTMLQADQRTYVLVKWDHVAGDTFESQLRYVAVDKIARLVLPTSTDVDAVEEWLDG